MDVKRQQGGVDQGDLLDQALMAALRHGAGSEGGRTCGERGATSVCGMVAATSLDAAIDGGGDGLGEPEPSLQAGKGEWRPAVAVARQPSAGRSRQGAGTKGTPVLPIRRRLQYLRAVDGGGRAGDGVGDVVPGRPAQTQGQPAEERPPPSQGQALPRSGNASSSATAWAEEARLASGARAWPAPRIACARSPAVIGVIALWSG
jgi:hypothetical protein